MVAKEYSKLVKDTTGWCGAYPLVIPIKVGDYFQVDADGAPIHLGSIFDRPDWSASLIVDSQAIQGSETYYAGCRREAGTTASGGVTPPTGLGAEATFSISFGRSAGFVLAYAASTQAHLRDVPKAQQLVVKLAKSGEWEENWFLVTEVIGAQSATVLVATEANAGIDLHANVTLPPGIKAVGVANPALGWTASSWRGSGYASLCKPATPLYHCVKPRKPFLRKWRAELLDVEPALDAAFSDDPYEDEDADG
jgi:hypothetical protein